MAEPGTQTSVQRKRRGLARWLIVIAAMAALVVAGGYYLARFEQLRIHRRRAVGWAH
jgi:hypothetical protein